MCTIKTYTKQRGCVLEVVVPWYAVGFIYIPGKLFFFITVQSYGVHIYIIEYIMARWSYSFVCTIQHRLIIIMQLF